ncbi:hypothetical protein EON65_24695 [archaeon]|nr:MAG: hypothetical protein EON65_24695 [archaeon]
MMSVDLLSGMVKLSRRQILDSRQPDTLSDLTHYTEAEMRSMILQEVPKFPIKPPRAWSKEYFSAGVATASDITKAMMPSASATATSSQQQTARPHRRHHNSHSHAQQGDQQQHAKNRGGHGHGYQAQHVGSSASSERRRSKPNNHNKDASKPHGERPVKITTTSNESVDGANSTPPPPPAKPSV